MMEHYNKGCSAIARPLLTKRLSIDQFDDECIKAIDNHYPWLHREGCLMTAVIYLWRCEYKSELLQDLEKAKAFLKYARRFEVAQGNMRKACLLYDCISDVDELIEGAIAPSSEPVKTKYTQTFL